MSRVILITGASRGIGFETARQLDAVGHRVILACRDPGPVQEKLAMFRGGGVNSSLIVMDVSDQRSVDRAIAELMEEIGHLDGLVNNAGVFRGHDPFKFLDSDISAMLETNLLGPWRVTLACLKLLEKARHPSVVNVSSTTASVSLTASETDIPGNPQPRLGYCCTKAGLNMLTAQWARAFRNSVDLAHIRINSVSPGYTATEMNNFCGDRHVSEAAALIAHYATLERDGPTGRFFGPNGEMQW